MPERRPKKVLRPDLGPSTHDPIDRPVVTPGHDARVDQSLASWTHFSLSCATHGWSRGAGGNYNPKTHKYNPDYINPKSYELRLDAKLGMSQNHTSTVPPDFAAYTWNVSTPDGRWHQTEIVQLPVKPTNLAYFYLPPREDTYDVRLRMTMKDGRFAERTVRFDIREWFIVSLGDSSASGQGNPDLAGTVNRHLGGGQICDHPTISLALEKTPSMNNKPEWLEPKAYRSAISMPMKAARSLEHASGQTLSSQSGDIDRFSFERITFASFARSGAEVLIGLVDPQEGDGDFIGVGQVEECKRAVKGRRIDVLMIDIGGNDAGFSGVFRDLVAKDSIYTGSLKGTAKALALSLYKGPPGDDAFGRKQIEKRLLDLLGVGLPPGEKGQLETHYDVLKGLVDDLSRSPGVGQVYITGYPLGMFENRLKDGTRVFRTCEVFDGPDMDMTAADERLIKRVGQELNKLIRRKAKEFGWHFVGVEKEFEGHGYCALGEGQRYWRTAKESCRMQGDFNGMMHPNEEGVRVWSEKFAASILENTIKPDRLKIETHGTGEPKRAGSQ